MSEAMLGDAIAAALAAEPQMRVDLFARLVEEIAEFSRAHPEERPWKYEMFEGTDGSRIFRGGTGQSIVIDPAGVIWRARSYEDFHTTYTSPETGCKIATLTPLYVEMRRYTPQVLLPACGEKVPRSGG